MSSAATSKRGGVKKGKAASGHEEMRRYYDLDDEDDDVKVTSGVGSIGGRQSKGTKKARKQSDTAAAAPAEAPILRAPEAPSTPAANSKKASKSKAKAKAKAKGAIVQGGGGSHRVFPGEGTEGTDNASDAAHMRNQADFAREQAADARVTARVASASSDGDSSDGANPTPSASEVDDDADKAEAGNAVADALADSVDAADQDQGGEFEQIEAADAAPSHAEGEARRRFLAMRCAHVTHCQPSCRIALMKVTCAHGT